MRGVLLCFAVVLILGALIGEVRSHDVYSGWTMPDSPGVSCCSEHDCRPVTASLDEDGHWVASVDGRAVTIPPHKVMKIQSPDGRSHWCGNQAATYCFVPGETRI